MSYIVTALGILIGIIGLFGIVMPQRLVRT